ncbi:MAG: dodecin family protein [Actinomycetota bacterium]|nr:dodecin family protein [Actinomycetota bacterium]
MTDNTYRIIEVVGSSTTGSDDAIANAVERASKTLENLDWFEVIEVRGHIKDGSIEHYQAHIKVGFKLNGPA